MATVHIPDEGQTIVETEEVAEYLSNLGITYERWQALSPLPQSASAEVLLAAYAPEIERLKEQGGYVAADVINVSGQTAGLAEMLAKFKREHWHDEDEVRFIIDGRGLFHVRPQSGPVIGIEVTAGDLVCVPAGTWHWFNLCSDLEIKAIRLFQKTEGWTPYYTESNVDLRYEPVCLGASYLPHKQREQI
ncbi:MAG TPA: cupin domain-containing protein [Pyrinomonadaceae bacterium]|jgi:1,2-dihydroxy-3-keto-5-methylthiopentene dioxygenase|nr:cupin domain-containing protein [Pyrinomonadaceae bacterium]